MKEPTGSYPQTPGFKATDTAREAAMNVASRAGTIRESIVAAFIRTGRTFTSDEMAVLLNEDSLAVRPRFTELQHSGDIEPTKERRPSLRGKSMIVYKRRIPAGGPAEQDNLFG